MVVINYEDQLQAGTFEHTIHHLIDNKLDLSIFHPNYQNDDNGRPAYDPAILLKIILFAYSKGITSSREIQWCCETNILFKALSCDTVPHFTTIAHFVSSHADEIETLFEQILLICHQSKVCWAMNCLPLTAARCRPTRPRNGRVRSRNWKRSGTSSGGATATS